MVRHQIYLEGFKSYQGQKFSDTAKAIEAEYRRRISGLEYETLDELTKAQLNKFIRELRDVNRRLYDAYVLKLIEELEEFMHADFDIITEVVDDNSEDDVVPTEEEKEEPSNLWASILNDPIPGVGQLLVPFLTAVGLGAIIAGEKAITRAWSNGMTKKELLEELIGEKAPTPIVPRDRLRSPKAPDPTNSTALTRQADKVPVAPPVGTVGGLVNRTRAQNQAAINTALQHVSQGVAELVLRRRYSRYMWVSVLDNRTTSICRERNGRIYNFGAGPLPPAHINCRSHIVPVL
jgi:SPP1 gp7 family putative phage head morphogenesis protein